MWLRRLGRVLMTGILLSACGSNGSPTEVGSVDCTAITAATIDDCVRLNEIQLLGTHNSYHVVPEPAILASLGTQPAAFRMVQGLAPVAGDLSAPGFKVLRPPVAPPRIP